MAEDSNHSEETQGEVPKQGGRSGLVFLTLFVIAIIATLASIPEYLGKLPEVEKALAAPEWWLENIGAYHTLILKVPIGIVFLTVAMELCSWLSFGRYRPMTGVGLFFALITGALACITGYVDMQLSGYKNEAWENHMWGGIGFVGILGLAFLAKIWSGKGGSKGFLYGILVLGSAGVMGWAAHIGGKETHGKDPITDTLVGLKLVKDPKAASQEGGEDESAAPVITEPKDRLAFAHVVMPIFESKCLACHSRDHKKKGGLLMDSFADLLEGGSSQDGDEYRTLVPGNAQQSYLIEVLNLPLDDDMHMPPEKKTQMEPYEIELLTWWINSIPASETLEDQTLSEMGAPQNIIDAASKLVTPEERKAAAEAKAAEEARVEAEKAAKREALQTALDNLKKEEAFKTSLNYASQESTDLEFTAVSLRQNLDDETFRKLAPVADALTSMKLGSTSLTEGVLIEELPKMNNLKKLDLGNNQVGDGVLEAVAQLEHLEWLNLYGTQVTDEGLKKLNVLSKLRKIYLWNSQATPEGAKALEGDLPGLVAVFGAQ